MTRLEALEAVAEAARRLDAAWQATGDLIAAAPEAHALVDVALSALDALPAAPTFSDLVERAGPLPTSGMAGADCPTCGYVCRCNRPTTGGSR